MSRCMSYKERCIISQRLKTVISAVTAWDEIKVGDFSWSKVNLIPSCYILPWDATVTKNGRNHQFECFYSITVFGEQSLNKSQNVSDINEIVVGIIDAIDSDKTLQQSHNIMGPRIETKYIDRLNAVAKTLIYTAKFRKVRIYPS